MQWWDDLWLNEGFASYVEYLGVDYVEPEWDMVRHRIKLTNSINLFIKLIKHLAKQSHAKGSMQ